MQKKIPQRQCMGCRERKDKRELLRVVRGTDGTAAALISAPERSACRRHGRPRLWNGAWKQKFPSRSMNG